MKKIYFILLGVIVLTFNSVGQSYFQLSSGALTQNWANTTLINANDDWSGYPNFKGFLGQELTTATATNPSTILTGASSSATSDIDVIANQTAPNALASGGVAEFETIDPTIALQGSGTADAPYLIIYLNTSGVSNINVQYNLRDLDGSGDNSIQPVALQYRIGNTGNFTNIPSGFVADASTGPTLATLITPVSVTLPAACENQSQIEIRIITSNAVGNDEWIGIDDISITSSPGGPDVTAPTVTTLSPADNATNVGINSNLQITFSETILKGTGNIVIKQVSDNSTVQTIDVTNAAVSITGSTATVAINALINFTDYYVEIGSGTFTDAALNPFAGISGSGSWNFTTAPVPAAGVIGNNYTFANCTTTFTNEGWIQYSVTGPSQFWSCVSAGRTDANAIQMNGFSGSAIANEDWLISPKFDLTTASLPTLQFYSRGEFTGNNLVLKVSTNYTEGTDPTTATWVDLNGNFPTGNTWTLSDNIDLSAYPNSNVRLAWVYTSTNAAAKRWSIDDVTVSTNVILPTCVEPTEQPANLVLNATSSNVTGSFTILPSPTTVENYLVVRSLSTPLTQLPVDASTYTAGQVIGGGNGTVIAISNDGTFTDNNTAPTTLYYYFVFAIEDQDCTGGPNYNQVNPLTNSITTPALQPCTVPSAPTNLVLNPGNTSISGSFTASGSSKYLVVISTTTPLSPSPSNTLTYSPGQAIGNGTVVSYNSTTTFTATGLTVATPYFFYVFAVNDACTGAPVYSTLSLDGNTTTTNNPTGIPPGYYDAVTTQTCAPLKTVLFNIIKPTTANPNPTYDGICTMYPSTDFKVSDFTSNNVIWDMYSDNPTGPDPYEFEYQVDVDGCGGSGANNPPIIGSAEGILYNREHSFPRSWFGGAVEPMNSDIMHIYPTDKEVNARRGSFPYGEVTSPSFTSLNGSKVGPNSTSGYGGTVFEPIDTYKGDFARSQFYMITAYEDKVAGWQPNQDAIFNGNSYTAFDDWYLLLMYQWHIADPVSPKEIARNNAAYLIQGNRNPYIDHPEYVSAVFQCATVLPVLLEDFTANLNQKAVAIRWKVSNEISFSKYEIQRSIDGNLFNTIGTVAARNIANYDFTDTNLPNAAVVYYRLKLIDIDGKYSFSKIVPVKLKSNLFTASLFPNPTADRLNIKLYEPLFTNSTLQVLDVTGRVVKQQNVLANTLNIGLDIQFLSAGRYFIKINNSQQVINQSFVVIE